MHRKNVSAAIKLKWQDPEYRARMDAAHEQRRTSGVRRKARAPQLVNNGHGTLAQIAQDEQDRWDKLTDRVDKLERGRQTVTKIDKALRQMDQMVRARVQTWFVMRHLRWIVHWHAVDTIRVGALMPESAVGPAVRRSDATA